jgi:uncharacterized protein DUF4157
VQRLTTEERRRLGRLQAKVDLSLVRLHRDGVGHRIVMWLSRGRSVALGNHVFLSPRCQGDVAVLAHELTHCGQYQAWGAVRYYGRGAAAQLRHLLHTVGVGSSPYDYRLEPDKPFESYGMEQQAMIVEDSFRG